MSAAPDHFPFGFVIRDYRPDDTAGCARIFDRAWHAGLSYAPRRIDAVVFASETIGESVLVALADERLAGFVSVDVPGKFLHHLFVDPDFWGRGIGRALLERGVKLLHGCAWLKCQKRNTGALAFYVRLGWRPLDEGEGEFGRWVRMLSPAASLD